VKNKGFTLIELIVVLVVISISIALVAPSLPRISRTVELKGAAKKISAILRYYRSVAGNQGKVYRVFFDSNLREVRVQSMEPTEGKGEEERKNEKSPQKVYSLPEGVQIKEIKVDSPQYPSDLPTIEFYPNGGSNGGTILLDSQDLKGYKIKIHFLTGIVVVERV
jgi:prepilin-type N-terminal cleavage/methylation domain-containing protein